MRTASPTDYPDKTHRRHRRHEHTGGSQQRLPSDTKGEGNKTFPCNFFWNSLGGFLKG